MIEIHPEKRYVIVEEKNDKHGFLLGFCVSRHGSRRSRLPADRSSFEISPRTGEELHRQGASQGGAGSRFNLDGGEPGLGYLSLLRLKGGERDIRGHPASRRFDFEHVRRRSERGSEAGGDGG